MSSKDSKEFQWTDALVLEFAQWTNNDSPIYHGRYADLEQFKESKQPKKEWEILEFKGDYFGESNVTFELKKNGKYVPVIPPYNEYDLQHVMPASKTHSVKRLSDGEVFQIGDNCREGEIKKFELSYWGKEISAIFESGDMCCATRLSDLIKTPKPKPLFVDAVFEQYIDEPKFPCLFVPLIFGNNSDFEYDFGNSDIVDCKIRGAGHYFKLNSAKQKIQGDK